MAKFKALSAALLMTGTLIANAGDPDPTLDLDAAVQNLKSTMVEAATDKSLSYANSYLEDFFPTVETSFSSGYNGGQSRTGGPTAGILLVKPLSSKDDVINTTFMQGSMFYQDRRTTLNLGLGYRKLLNEKTLLAGINVFYDHEFPYDHNRTSVGLEARTTAWEVNANRYWALSDWKAGRNGAVERALDGYDIEFGLPFPYMNWATLFVKRYQWDAHLGASDIKGNDVQFRLRPPPVPGLEIQIGRTYSQAELSDQNHFNISYNIMALFEKGKKSSSPTWISESAYKLASMEEYRYDKVRRQNLIVKQTSSTLIVKGY